ncbi:MAG: hypothetical protein ACFB6R_09810 [Alphaproteobacteria bacterium]
MPPRGRAPPRAGAPGRGSGAAKPPDFSHTPDSSQTPGSSPTPGTLTVKAARPAAASASRASDNPVALTRQVLAERAWKEQAGDVVSVPYKDGASLLRTMKPKAAFENGGLKGLYLQGKGDGTVAGELGVAQGDLLVAVNGIRLTSRQRVEKVWDRLDSAGPLSLVIERDGAERTVNVLIGRALSR